jgi:glycosyltransferase involved in cell wall biosynthesis
MKLTVIIPVYNEEKTVVDVIEQVRRCGAQSLQIVIVNDCSSDGTKAALEKLPEADDLLIVHHEKNRGKGAAIRTAQSLVEGDVMVIQDADMEYSPDEFPAMLQLVEDGLADAVFGSRYSGREILVDGFWHYVANKFLTTLSNMFSNIHLTDMETCYKMVRADLFKDLSLECNRFGIEPELTAKLARRKCRIYEVPISYKARRFDEGKKIGWKDGVAAIWYIFKYNILSRERRRSKAADKSGATSTSGDLKKAKAAKD